MSFYRKFKTKKNAKRKPASELVRNIIAGKDIDISNKSLSLRFYLNTTISADLEKSTTYEFR